ncbi:DUF1275 domain-containing protein [Endozoicomonas sp. OPT23]|uniref:YoaK family protein n=1 Tax=Endozoicomonas sp. OPT23 TaxID=2072845 RepID=UPI00129BFE87|nr:YoaK family protein [Endozoicomonas sp. OPT23]MRI33465.1 DUF1275 domain-containing protein [Endozoicomonas sp. OPT23]
MIRKLPLWVWVGGVLLTLSAGLVNSVALLSFSNQAVTHVTGSVTLASTALAQQNWAVLSHLSMVVFCFFLGAVLGGVITRGSRLRLGRRYGVALIVECFLLLVSMMLFKHSSFWGQMFASLACGLQNALVSTFSHAVIRTTHMSGIVTDLGAKIGYWLSGRGIDKRRFALYLLLLSGFFTGGVLGAWCFGLVGYKTLILAALITGLSGILSLIHVMGIRRRSESLVIS